MRKVNRFLCVEILLYKENIEVKKMSVICDYHIHTHLCKHATGSPEEYLAQAHKKGLNTIGFSDHCPVPIGFDSTSRMDISQFSEYVDIINELKDNPYGIEVLFGMEIDWVPGRMNEVEDFLSKIEYDYLIGSVHYVDNLPFDHPDHYKDWDNEDGIEYVWSRYFELMYDFVSWGKFDIMGHLDLPKKYSMYPECMKKVYEIAERVFSLAADKNILLELNTSGLRRLVEEIFPSGKILEIAYRNGVKIVFGSDAHESQDVGRDFDLASDLAKSVGYKEYCRIRKNKEPFQLILL
jgi:histidinol-phosphatase (PHP family)